MDAVASPEHTLTQDLGYNAHNLFDQQRPTQL